MSRVVSLNARMVQDAHSSDEIYVALMEITHPELASPIRLSTDNADLISEEPYIRGTRSTWRSSHSTDPFLWIVASTVLPSDLDDAPAAATIILENLDRRMAEIVRSFTTPATFHMAVVLASSADLVEAEYTDLLLTSAEITAGEISLSISREEIESEIVPNGKMTARTFPGLHR
ncbi:UNVERIFIED_ORG: DUF1833 domain-containing protein [Roseateles sp. XES5]|nr:DUF1833 family protein [Roseateles sp. XES5]